jgi:hypothetical protein
MSISGREGLLSGVAAFAIVVLAAASPTAAQSNEELKGEIQFLK